MSQQIVYVIRAVFTDDKLQDRQQVILFPKEFTTLLALEDTIPNADAIVRAIRSRRPDVDYVKVQNLKVVEGVGLCTVLFGFTYGTQYSYVVFFRPEQLVLPPYVDKSDDPLLGNDVQVALERSGASLK